MNFQSRFAVVVFAFAFWGLLAGGCSIITRMGNSPSANYVAPRGEAAREMAKGKALFEAKCQKCHGERAGGTWRMPSLVSPPYGPKQLTDRSFHLTVMNGARSRYWLNFKGMQPIKNLSQEEAEAILRFVRDLQKQAGIY